MGTTTNELTVHFVNVAMNMQFDPPMTVERLADIASETLNIPVKDFMHQCKI